MLQPELVLIALAALAPAVAAGAILVMVARPAGRAWIGALVAFVWGAVVAALAASALNDVAAARLPPFVSAHWIPTVVGPVIEELAKAGGFLAVALVAGRAIAGVRGMMAIGALIGLGFAVAENVGYYVLAAVQGGYGGLGRAIYLRGVIQSGNHALFTATLGAALGAAGATRGGRRVAIGAFGLAAAIALHVVWNAGVSQAITTVLCNAPDGSASCAPAPDASDLLLAVPALEAAFLLPALGVLARLARRSP